MHRSWIVAISAAVAMSAAAACSNDQSAQDRTGTAGSTAADSNRTESNPSVTLTGCLIQGSSPSTFVLQNARAKDNDRNIPSPISTSYVLIASSNDVDLAKQLNHEVEIKGRSDTMAGASSSAGSTGSTGTTGSTGSTAAQRAQSTSPSTSQELPRFMVSDVKSVADRCTAPSPQ